MAVPFDWQGTHTVEVDTAGTSEDTAGNIAGTAVGLADNHCHTVNIAVDTAEGADLDTAGIVGMAAVAAVEIDQQPYSGLSCPIVDVRTALRLN